VILSHITMREDIIAELLRVSYVSFRCNRRADATENVEMTQLHHDTNLLSLEVYLETRFDRSRLTSEYQILEMGRELQAKTGVVLRRLALPRLPARRSFNATTSVPVIFQAGRGTGVKLMLGGIRSRSIQPCPAVAWSAAPHTALARVPV
jgi:hypothetical protein